MAKSTANRLKSVVVLLAVCVSSALLGFILGDTKLSTAGASKPSALQQSNEKVIVAGEHEGDPLKFSDLIHLKNIKTFMGRRFSLKSKADGAGKAEDWLEDLEFSFENKSSKRITYVCLELLFPDTQVDGPIMVYDRWTVGIPPKSTRKSSNYEPLNYGEPLALNPGDALTLTLSAKDLKPIKEFLALRKYQLSDINKVIIQVLYVIFDDGIKWTLGGSYFRPNPNARGGYERINQ